MSGCPIHVLKGKLTRVLRYNFGYNDFPGPSLVWILEILLQCQPLYAEGPRGFPLGKCPEVKLGFSQFPQF